MDRSMLVRRVAPVAVFAAVIGGIVAINLRHQPALHALPIAASGANTRDSAAYGAVPAAASESKVRAGYGAKIHIKDSLLVGLPDKGPAYTLGSADDADVAALARALGIAGDVQHDDEGAYVGTGDRVLRVSTYGGRPWYLGGARDGVVSSDGSVGSTGSGVATPVTAAPAPATSPNASPNAKGQEPAIAPCPPPAPGSKDACVPPDQVCTEPADAAKASCEPYTPPKPPPSPSDDDARTAAAPVFAALGLGSAPVTVDEGWGTKSVAASPVVHGLPTSGYETRVEVDVHGDVVGGNGFLAAVGSGDDYPLLDPRASVERGGGMYDTPVALGAPCDAKTGCPTSAPVPDREVSAIRPGLVFLPSYDSTKAFLAPAWLLSFADDTYELPVLALPDRYLEPAPTAKPDQPTEPGGSADPGTPESGGPAVDVPPASGSSGSSGSSGGSAGSTGAPAKP
jgi:hypothetical protein